MKKDVRVRFAPSPTGLPHVGNIRTALFNWLFARHYGGKFVVRIEDTDQSRLVNGAVEAILDGLGWLGLDWDEGPEIGGPYGPYFQSQRLELYQEIADRLVKQGDAYYCYCSSERLAAMRAEQERLKLPPGYDRHCRNLDPEEEARYIAQGITPVVRMKVPTDGETTFHDLIRGDVTFKNATLDDFVLLKSDHYPTYHLANVVDDWSMKISHVLRAEEWLSSTPRHLLIYKALGFEPPEFAHLPMILGPDRSKLSKRHGAVSIIEYKEKGYLPQAMFNFLALLGWSIDDKTEITSREDIINSFSLERVSKTAAIFNIEKLNWMNGVYIRQLSLDEFTKVALPFLERGLPSGVSRPLSDIYVRDVLSLVQERTKLLSDVPELVSFFFVDDLDYDVSLLLANKIVTPVEALRALEASEQKVAALKDFGAEALEAVLRPLAQELGLRAADLFGLLRVAVTGRTVAPPLFRTMSIMGREKCLRRIKEAIDKVRAARIV